MISSTSKKPLFIYIGVTAFVGLFSAVYEYFSHGVYSAPMILAFLVPLVLGVLVELLGRRWPRLVASAWSNIFRSFAIATLTVGMILTGVMEIYGTTNSHVIYFFVAGGVMLLVGLGCWLKRRC